MEFTEMEQETTAVEVFKAGEISPAESAFMPVMRMDVALARRQAIVEFTKQIMVEDQDFGVIPGTKKPSLLKPGAEKLCCFFGLEPEFTPIVEETDWTGEKHNGEAFFYVRYRCRLLRDGRVLGVGEGSCNSWESKYRYRDAKRKCPECGAETLIKGKPEYERDPRFKGGMLCFEKRGGCGAKFTPDDPQITGQVLGRVPNPDAADIVNTIQKMAQKRALVAATLIATSASEFFTQDTEDMPRDDSHTIDTGGAPNGTKEAQTAVRDRKVAEMEKRPESEMPRPEPEPVPEQVEVLWKRMGSNPKEIRSVVTELCDSLALLLGDREAEVAYGKLVAPYGQVNPMSKITLARRFVFDLYKLIQVEQEKQGGYTDARAHGDDHRAGVA